MTSPEPANASETAGARIGRYELLEPVKRRVAPKIIEETKQVIGFGIAQATHGELMRKTLSIEQKICATFG